MTRSRSSRGRHRPRVGRPQPGVVEETRTGQVESETLTPDQPGAPLQPDPRPDASRSNERGPTTQSRRQGGRGGLRPGPPDRVAQQGPGDGSGPRQSRGQGRHQRRRQQRSPQPLAMPGEILKERAPVTLTMRPIEKRRVEDMTGENGPMFGCPMLTRTRLALPVAGNHPSPRCSLGWALHSEDEALLCMYTEDVPSCWKAHPEHVEEIRSRMLERETAAD